MNSEIVLTLEAVCEALDHVKHSIALAAERLVGFLDAHPEMRGSLIERGYPSDFLDRLERFGRKQLHPELVFASGAGFRRLLSLPLSVQSVALGDGVDVLDGDETSVRRIPIADLTPAQCKVVFARDRIRSIAEQRTILRDARALPAPVKASVDYKVQKDGVVIAKPGVFSRELVREWFLQLFS